MPAGNGSAAEWYVNHIRAGNFQKFSRVGEAAFDSEPFGQLHRHEFLAVAYAADFATGQQPHRGSVFVRNFSATNDRNFHDTDLFCCLKYSQWRRIPSAVATLGFQPSIRSAFSFEYLVAPIIDAAQAPIEYPRDLSSGPRRVCLPQPGAEIKQTVRHPQRTKGLCSLKPTRAPHSSQSPSTLRTPAPPPAPRNNSHISTSVNRISYPPTPGRSQRSPVHTYRAHIHKPIKSNPQIQKKGHACLARSSTPVTAST